MCESNVCDAPVGKECKLREQIGYEKPISKSGDTESFPFAGEGQNSKNSSAGYLKLAFGTQGRRRGTRREKTNPCLEDSLRGRDAI